MRILLTTAALAAALLVSTPSISYAQDAEDAEILRMAKEHYKLGLDAFKAGKYPEAIKELKKAYLLKRLPPLLVNIAKTYDKLNDLDNSIYYYKKYLAEAPPDAKDRDQVKQALAEIQQRKNAPAEEASRSPEDLPEAKGPSRGGDTAEEAPAPRPRRRPVAETEEAAPPEDNAPRPRRRPVAETEQAPPPEEAAPPPRPRRRATEEEQAPPDETVARTTTRPRRTDDEGTAPPPRRTPPPPVENEEPAPRAKAPPANVPMPTEWAHNPIDAAPPQSPVDVRVQTPVMKGVKVYLYYREAGQADFTPVLMKRHGSEKVGRIPGEAMAGKSIQYYIEAKDKTGNVVKSSGSQVDPNIVMIEQGAPSQMLSGGGRSSEGDEVGGDEIASGDEQRPPPVSRPRGEEHPLDAGPSPDEPEPRKPAGPKGPFFKTLGWIGVGVTGLGVGAIVGGVVSVVIANRNSNLLYTDATNTNCRNQANSKYSGKCYFLDPAFQTGQSDYDFDQQGKTAGIIAPIALVGGGLMVAGGVAMMVIDYVMLHPSQPSAPKKKQRRRAAPTREEQSSIQNLIVAPIFSPTTVGAAAGFNF